MKAEAWARRVKAFCVSPRYYGDVHGAGRFRQVFERLADRWTAPQRGAFKRTPEAERLQSALDMHDLGVRLYRQRMLREHPDASGPEIDWLVRAWLTSPPRDSRLRLPSRERGHGIAH
jgi:hypothetical protein